MKKLFQLMVVSLAIVALTNQAFAQQQDTVRAKNPLVRLLQSKGIITEQEATMIGEASTPAQAERRLMELLLAKGVITRQEYEQTILALGAGSTSSDATAPRVVTAAAHVTETSTATAVHATVEPAAKEAGSAQSQAQGEVTTVSKFPLKIYGSILFNANYVSHGANTIDIP